MTSGLSSQIAKIYDVPSGLLGKMEDSLGMKKPIDYSLTELALIATLPLSIKLILLSLASPYSLNQFQLYANTLAINLRDLERIALGRMIPVLGWPSTLTPVLKFIQALLDYEFPLSLDSAWNSPAAVVRQYARINGMSLLRVGTFPPVLPARIVFSNLSNVLNKENGNCFRAHEGMLDPWLNFFVGVDSAALVLFSEENRRKVSFEWLVSILDGFLHDELTEEPPFMKFAGFLYGASLTGVALPLSFICNLLLKFSEYPRIKAVILASLSQQPSSEQLIKLLLLNCPFVSGTESLIPRNVTPPSRDEYCASVFSLGMILRGSGDRQLIHQLFQQLSSIHYSLISGFGLIMITNSLKEFTDQQQSFLLRWSNGVCDGINNQYLEFISIVILMLLGDEQTADCLNLSDKSTESGFTGFVRSLAVILLTGTIPSFDEDCDWWSKSAQIFSLCFLWPNNPSETVPFENYLFKIQFPSLKDSFFDAVIEHQGVEFCRDIHLLTCSILFSGTGDARVLNLLRARHTDHLNYDYGRSVIYYMSVGFLFLGAKSQKLNLSDRKLLFFSILPFWQLNLSLPDNFTMTYPPYFRFLWLRLLDTPRIESLINLREDLQSIDFTSFTTEDLKLLSEFADFCELSSYDSVRLLFDPLQICINLAKSTKPSLNIF
jgi:hypothetical protein